MASHGLVGRLQDIDSVNLLRFDETDFHGLRSGHDFIGKVFAFGGAILPNR
jgi:putative methionine-R-sulfoxide reductase with GAF domain